VVPGGGGIFSLSIGIVVLWGGGGDNTLQLMPLPLKNFPNEKKILPQFPFPLFRTIFVGNRGFNIISYTFRKEEKAT
jgi:hypothetical protein